MKHPSHLLPILLFLPIFASCGDDDPVTPSQPTPSPTPTDTTSTDPTPTPTPTPTAEVVGWPASYGGVMLQGFYWDGYGDAQWTRLEAQADELAPYFSLVWIPQSGNCGGTSMGYDDLYWFTNYNSSFGTEAELRSMIQTFKQKGIGTIADVVINHRRNVSNWVDFPAETYNGVTYEMVSTDICANDDGGATKNWASQNGYSLSSANDTGEGWDGMRDLDHTSANVQTIVKAYLDFLLNDLGYAGFRYDMVKGYAGTYTKLYNESAKPGFSVGEYWDGNAATVKNWITATGKTSAAFDFPFRYTVRNALRGSSNDNNSSNWRQDADYSLLAAASIASDAAYRQWAVTFVENHDTEYRSAATQQDPIRRDTLAANAFLLAMPGTPCVFFKHWKAYKYDIARMIQARQTAGIQNTSNTTRVASSRDYYAFVANGTAGKLLAWIGDESSADAASFLNKLPSEGYTRILAGQNYSYWLETALLPTWNALPEPTFASTQVQRHDVTVYLRDPGWQQVYFYAWDGNLYIDDSWPGKQITATKTIGDTRYYYRTFNVSAEASYSMNIIFDQGMDKLQTVDITGITSDRYYEIADTNADGKLTVRDITAEVNP